MANSTLVIDASIKALEMILKQTSYIQYSIKFCKNKKLVWALINFGSEVNAITPVYATILDLKVYSTDVAA